MRRAQERARSATFKNSAARSATIESRALGALKLASEARDENVPAKRADFFIYFRENFLWDAYYLKYFDNSGDKLTLYIYIIHNLILFT